MATRAIAIRDAVVTELLKIGVTPGSGWESGAGAPTVLAGRPKRDAIDSAIERQVWVMHGGTDPLLDGFTAGGCQYRAELHVWLVCPNPAGGDDLLSKLERDVRRAIQLGQSTLEGANLAQAGIREGSFESSPDLGDAGVAAGMLRVHGDYLTGKGDP